MRTKLMAATALLVAIAGTVPMTAARTQKRAAVEQNAAFDQKLPKNQEILHALNRLTYGPRPGDVQAVSKIGLKKWIDQQLHPDSIAENPALAAKLAHLTTLNMTTSKWLRTTRLPSTSLRWQPAAVPLPDDPEKRQLIERLATRYKKRRPEKINGENLQITPAEKTLAESDSDRAIRSSAAARHAEERATLLRAIPKEKLGRSSHSHSTENGRKGLFAAAPARAPAPDVLTRRRSRWWRDDLAEAKISARSTATGSSKKSWPISGSTTSTSIWTRAPTATWSPPYERDAIRPHVLGKFRDLLEATAKSPAMLFYLDNWQSVGAGRSASRGARRRSARGLNENYGRELLELHTLGVDGGYTQKDVTEVARCFTGWTITRARSAAATFVFNARLHDKGEKTVLGVTIPAGGGIEDGEKVLDIVAHHPSTARFISRKLAQRFVADDPPRSPGGPHGEDLPEDRWRSARGDEDHAGLARNSGREGAYRSKVKTPLEMVASAVRAVDARRRLRLRAGQPDRAARPAAVPQAGADRLLELRARSG